MEHLPPWLRNVPLPRRPDAPAAPAADLVPDWLREVEPVSAPPPSAAAAPPDWLQPSEPSAASSADDTPDWLRELQGEMGTLPPTPQPSSAAPASPPSADTDTPDWLRDLEQAVAPPDASQTPRRPTPHGATSWLHSLGESTPDAEQPAQPEQPPTTTSRVRMPVGATDWLRSIGQETEFSASELPAEDEPPPPAAPATADNSGVPDWLLDVTPEALASAVEADQPEPEVPSADLNDLNISPDAANWLVDLVPDAPRTDDDSISRAVPDWLADITPADSNDSSAPPRGAAAIPSWLEDDAADASPQGIPDWLQDAEATRATPDAADDVPAWLHNAEPAAPSAPPPADDVPAWLRDAEPAAPSAPPPADDVPAWLRDAEPAAPSAPAPADDVPAWLRDAEPAAPSAPAPADDVPAWLRDAEPAAPSAPAPADDVPAWLRDAEPAAPSAPAPADDVPAWLRDAEPAAPSAPAPADDVPAWLRDAEPAAPSAPAPADDVPAWLRDAEPAAPSAPRAPAPADDVPAWLRDAEPAAPSAPAPADDVPAWLRDAEPAAPSAPADDVPPWLSDAGASTDAPAIPSDPQAEMNLPAWLRGVTDEPVAPPPPRTQSRTNEPSRRSVPASDADESGFLSGADLPSWLRISEPERPSESPEGQTLDWLTRLGSNDTETEEPEQVAAPAVIALPKRRIYQRTSEQLEAIELLNRLVQTPYPTPVAAPLPQPQTRWERIGIERVLYGVLILCLLIGLIVPGLTGPIQTSTPSAPGADELRAVLSNLDSEQVVLVAYEWAAQRSGELRPLEDAITAELIAQRAKLILVSTDLQGTLLAFDRIDPLREAGYNAAGGGTDYVLLGYRPGGELALRSLARNLRGELARDFNGNDATQSLVATNLDGTPRISSIRDLALIVVMVDQPQDVQAWMEQVHWAARDVPIAFLLPQETQPLVQPYLRLDNVYHVAGLQGALALQAGSSGDPIQIARATGQAQLAIIVFVVLLIGGAIGMRVIRARKSR